MVRKIAREYPPVYNKISVAKLASGKRLASATCAHAEQLMSYLTITSFQGTDPDHESAHSVRFFMLAPCRADH